MRNILIKQYIYNYINNKLIGIHKEGYNNKLNKGLFLNYPIKEFIELYSKNNNELLL